MFPKIAKTFTITKTVTDVFCNVRSNGRFSPIGGSRAIFTDEIPPKLLDHFPIPETVTYFLKCQSNGRFSPIGGNRAIFTDRFPPILPNHLPSQRLSHNSEAMFRAMGDFHRSVEIARFLPMSVSPKSPNNLPFHRPSQISFAMFSAMGDFHRSVEIARFLPMKFPPTIAKPFPISFCNVQSNGRFSPIGGNCAIFTDEIPSHFPSKRLS